MRYPATTLNGRFFFATAFVVRFGAICATLPTEGGLTLSSAPEIASKASSIVMTF
jgi:hypothetical protein